MPECAVWEIHPYGIARRSLVAAEMASQNRGDELSPHRECRDAERGRLRRPGCAAPHSTGRESRFRERYYARPSAALLHGYSYRAYTQGTMVFRLRTFASTCRNYTERFVWALLEL